MQVEFKTKKYDLMDGGIHNTNMNNGANILNLDLLNVESIDELISEATDCEKITVYDGERVDSVFEDYINFQGVVANAEGYVELTVSQPSMVQQVVNLKAKVAEQQEIISIQEAHIVDLETSQGTQNSDISDLTDAVLEMSEIVYGEAGE